MKTTTDRRFPEGQTSIEAALRDARLVMAPRQKRIWPWVIGSQVAVLVLGYFLMPYFTTRLSFDQEAMEAEEALIAERARAYREKEKAVRTNREIREEHADPLKRQEREMRRQEVLAHLHELESIALNMREVRDIQLDRLLADPGKAAPEEFETRLEESLRNFTEATETLKANELISSREPFEESAGNLIEDASTAMEKANTPTGLDLRDREELSDKLTKTSNSLEELQDANRDTWSGAESDELDEAQEMANLLKALPNRLKQAGRQIQSAESRLEQQRNRLHDEIKREIARIRQSHRGLLAHKNRSQEIEAFSQALENLESISKEQKSSGEWNHEKYETSYRSVKGAAEDAKRHVEQVRQLGDLRETMGLTGLLNNQQRQTETQRTQWEQLVKRQREESTRAQQSLTAAIGKLDKQWDATKSKLPPEDRPQEDKAVRMLLQQATRQSQSTTPLSPDSVRAHKMEADRLASRIQEATKNDQEDSQESARLRTTLQSLSQELEKQSQALEKHGKDKQTMAGRIADEWQRARKQLNDKVERASPGLAGEESPLDPESPAAETYEKVRTSLRKMSEEAGNPAPKKEINVDDLGAKLTARSKGLSDLAKQTRELHQAQTKLQNGITRDESAKLDRNLANLEKALGLRRDELARQAKVTLENIARQERELQKSLDQVTTASAHAKSLKSEEARRVAETLEKLPQKAPELLTQAGESQAPFERIAKAEEFTKDWLQRAKGEAPVRQTQLANTRQTLRELAEAMTAAGLTRQNADAATSLLEEGPLDPLDLDPATLEEAVAAAEDLHHQIHEDFQTFRAADIAARTGQSLEQLQQLTGNLSAEQAEIEVPGSNPDIKTVGDLREYRKAMDKAVSQTEGLAQNARTLQRQALGESSPTLAQALINRQSESASPSEGAGSPVNVGVDPRGRKFRLPSNTWHQMTFEDVHIPTGRIDVEKIKAEALPGRRFTDESLRQGWLYVDTWYIIGPWENFGKINWSNVHPPEFEVDLAKAYPDGKGGRELRWQFTQHPAIRCDVPDETTNSSYYAYTELYFDKPREMLVAVASNDAGKLWIDGEVVWQDNGLSSWNLDEGFRRVRFKEGFSKILIRVENGPRNCQFSLLLCPPGF